MPLTPSARCHFIQYVQVCRTESKTTAHDYGWAPVTGMKASASLLGAFAKETSERQLTLASLARCHPHGATRVLPGAPEVAIAFSPSMPCRRLAASHTPATASSDVAPSVGPAGTLLSALFFQARSGWAQASSAGSETSRRGCRGRHVQEGRAPGSCWASWCVFSPGRPWQWTTGKGGAPILPSGFSGNPWLLEGTWGMRCWP